MHAKISGENHPTYSERDFLCQSMDVHDGGVSRANDILVVQNRQLCLELADSVHRLVGGRQYKSWADIFVLNTA